MTGIYDSWNIRIMEYTTHAPLMTGIYGDKQVALPACLCAKSNHETKRQRETATCRRLFAAPCARVSFSLRGCSSGKGLFTLGLADPENGW